MCVCVCTQIDTHIHTHTHVYICVPCKYQSKSPAAISLWSTRAILSSPDHLLPLQPWLGRQHSAWDRPQQRSAWSIWVYLTNDFKQSDGPQVGLIVGCRSNTHKHALIHAHTHAHTCTHTQTHTQYKEGWKLNSAGGF